MQRYLGYVLVLVQFVCLLYLAATGPWVARDWLLAVELFGIGLGLWAVWSMRIARLNITPHVRPDVELVARGPYRWIRHPMYSALLITGLALVLNAPSPARWAVWGALALDLVIKLHYEERLLAAALPAYDAYRSRTKRLLPWIY